MASWREKLHKKIQIPTPKELTKPTKASSVSFVSSQRGDIFIKTGISAVESSDPENLAKPSNWPDLECELDAVQRRYETGELTAAQVEQVAHRATRLGSQLPEDAKDASQLRLSDLFREQPIRRVWSRALGVEVLFAADGVEVLEGNTLAVYRESELRQLVGKTPDQMRAIHKARTVLDGEVIKELHTAH